MVRRSWFATTASQAASRRDFVSASVRPADIYWPCEKPSDQHGRLIQRSRSRIEPNEGEREAGHFLAGQIGAEIGARHFDALALQNVAHMPIDDHQFHLRRGAEIVEQQRDAVAPLERQIGEQQARHLLGQFIGGHELAALDAGLAMRAHADLDLVIGEFEGQLAGLRHRAGADGDADRADIVLRVLDGLLGLFERLGFGADGAGDLAHVEGAGDAAAILMRP